MMETILYDKIINIDFYRYESHIVDDYKVVSKEQYEAMGVEKQVEGSDKTIKEYPEAIYDRKTKTYRVKQATQHVDKVRHSMRLECEEYGFKPTVLIHFGLLPGYNVYDITIKIVNLCLPFDIRECTRLRVECGYADTSLRQSFTMSVFSAYNESPRPDSITVFRGVIVTSLESIFTDKPYGIEIQGGQSGVKLNIFIETFAKAITTGEIEKEEPDAFTGLMKKQLYRSTLNVLMKFRREYLDYEAIGPNEEYKAVFNNGLSAIQALCRRVIAITDKYRPVGTSQVQATIWEDQLLLFDDSYEEEVTMTKPLVKVDNVKNASFAGPALTLLAPWIPTLLPGDMFEMEPSFFNEGSVPNVNDTALELNPAFWTVPMTIDEKIQNLYLWRVITIKVDFDTTGSTNQMEVFAIPVSKEKAKSEDDIKRDVAFADQMKEMQKIADLELPMAYGTVVFSGSEEKFERVFSNVPKPTAGCQDVYTDTSNMTLIERTEEYIPRLICTWQDIEPYMKKFKTHNDYLYTRCTGVNLWPLTYLCTVYAMRNEKENQAAADNAKGYNTVELVVTTQERKKNVIGIVPGSYTFMPQGSYDSIGSLSVFSSYKDLLKDLADYYEDSPWPELATDARCLYVFLGGSYAE